MFPPHVIRLRGRWEYQPLARTVLLPDGSTRVEDGTLPAAGSMPIPAGWAATLGSDFRGRVRYTRVFHWLTDLDDRDRVELVVEQVNAFADVTLNATPLGRMQYGGLPTRFNNTSILRPRNELSLVVELPRLCADSPVLACRGQESQPGGVLGEVRLEVYSTRE